jgi:hypothetical protein
VVIVANETAHITLTYAEAFGTLRVVLNPAGAHNDGAQWRLDNGEWRSGGQDLISAQAGTHLLSFHDLSGWTKPADETIEIQADATLDVVREYAAVLGARTLQVNLAPAEAVLAGAQWSLDGTTWYSSGATITPPEGTAGGQHVIKFKSALGWIKPGDKIITVEAAEAKVLSYDYQRTTELLTVNIEPTEALLAGARWRLDGGEWQSQTGEPFAASVGAHVISFEVLAGWTKPADAVFEIAAGEEKTVTGTYPTGVLNVQLTPQDAVLDGAKWRTDIDGELWRNSTTQPVRIPTGQHVISFKPLMSPDENILAWTTPADQYINLTADQQFEVAAVYEQGGLQVNIEPAQAVSEGAQWRVDGGAWHVTGYTISEISTGAHTLEFAPLDDWAAPTVSTVVVASGHTATTTARYRQGALSVSLLPEAAISLGARWKVGNRPWHASGETQDRLPAGDQIVTFDDLAGWDTPQPMTIRVEDGLTTPAVASYIQQFGGVRVTISPDRANTNLAQWRVDDGRWVFSGEFVWNIAVGIHTITFTPISGWQAEPIQVEVKKDALTEATGVYPTGRVTVAIVPDLAIQSGAKWSVAGGPLHNSGDTEVDVPAGSQTVTLTALAGWQAPAAISVEVIEGELIQILGRYPHGALQVTLTPPEAVAAGVTWSLDTGDGPWQTSGTLLEVVPSGMHQILYSAAPGWARPLPASVEVLDGQIYNFESVGFAPAGDISVLIEPEGARAAGAGWQIACDAWDCGETHASGDVLSGVPVGQREIDFTAIPGWKTPDSVTIDVAQGANTAPLTASYIANSVTVNLAPLEAVEAGGMWRLDDGDWLAGGATASAVVRGEHILEYRGINGWIAPPPEAIFIADGDALTFSRSYAPFWASVRITINPEQARSEGAQWQVDGGSWQDSGATVGIGMGGHTVTFKPMDGWESPAAISFAPDSNGQVLTFEGTYSCAGMIGAPVNVKASDGEYDDRIVVTWDALPGASEYLVYRATDERVEAAGPVGGWVTEPKYEDFSAEPPKSSGCFGSRVAHNYYYYVVARNGKGCVSPVSNIDDGHAGDVN